MIRHIFTLLWNQRRKYIGIFAEQALVFFVVVICLVSFIGAWNRYHSAGMLDTRDTYAFGHMLHSSFNNADVYRNEQLMAQIADNLRKKDYVVAISYNMMFTPYMRPDEYYWSDSITVSADKKIWAQLRGIDQWGDEVYNIKPLEGRWYTDDERPNGHTPVLATRQFVEAAGLDNPVGKVLGQDFEIVGVIEGAKTEVFVEAKPAVIVPMSSLHNIWMPWFVEYVARLKPGHEEELYTDFYAEYNRLIGNAANVQLHVGDLNSARQEFMTDTVTEVAFLAIPSLFLLIFAFMGTMGLTLMNLRGRIPELAVRVAIGSTRAGLAKFVILQNLVISVMALVPGLVVAAFVWEWDATNLTAIGFAVGLILLFSLLSTIYPVRTLSKLNPATALKNE